MVAVSGRRRRRECRLVEVDGQMIRVQGDGEMDEETRAALAEVIRAVQDMTPEEHAAMSEKARQNRAAECTGIRRGPTGYEIIHHSWCPVHG